MTRFYANINSRVDVRVFFFDLGIGNTSAILLRKYAIGNRGAQSLLPDLSKSLGTYPPTPPLDRNTNQGEGWDVPRNLECFEISHGHHG